MGAGASTWSTEELARSLETRDDDLAWFAFDVRANEINGASLQEAVGEDRDLLLQLTRGGGSVEPGQLESLTRCMGEFRATAIDRCDDRGDAKYEDDDISRDEGKDKDDIVSHGSFIIETGARFSATVAGDLATTTTDLEYGPDVVIERNGTAVAVIERILVDPLPTTAPCVVVMDTTLPAAAPTAATDDTLEDLRADLTPALPLWAEPLFLHQDFIASVTAANYKLDESPNLNTKKRVDDCRKRADAVAVDSPRLIVVAVVAVHFDFCLRLKATDGSNISSHKGSGLGSALATGVDAGLGSGVGNGISSGLGSALGVGLGNGIGSVEASWLGDVSLGDGEKLKLMEMNDSYVEYHPVGKFLKFCIKEPNAPGASSWASTFPGKFLNGGTVAGGQLVDQRLLPRIDVGELHMLMARSSARSRKRARIKARLRAAADVASRSTAQEQPLSPSESSPQHQPTSVAEVRYRTGVLHSLSSSRPKLCCCARRSFGLLSQIRHIIKFVDPPLHLRCCIDFHRAAGVTHSRAACG